MKILCLLILLSCQHIRTSPVNLTTSDHHDSGSHGNDTQGHQNGSLHTEGHVGHGEHGIHLLALNYEYVKSPLLITIFLFAAGISKLGFHHADFLSSRVPESCLLIILGIIVGAILRFTVQDPSIMPGMSSTLFFLYLLPPIILESAWSLHDRTFFDNVGTVLIYAVIVRNHFKLLFNWSNTIWISLLWCHGYN